MNSVVFAFLLHFVAGFLSAGVEGGITCTSLLLSSLTKEEKIDFQSNKHVFSQLYLNDIVLSGS